MRVLIVAGRPPWPPWRGDQLRARQWAEALGPHHEVTLLAPPAPPAAALPGVRMATVRTSPAPFRLLRSVAALARGLPAQCGLYQHPDLTRQVRRLVPEHDLAVLLLARLAPQARELERLPWVVDLVDALSLSFRRRAELDSPLRAWLWRGEAHRLQRTEGRLLRAAARSVVVSERDREELLRAHPGAAGRLRVVPVAGATWTEGPLPPSHPPTLALTGNLGYFVNRDALRWWLREIWPKLRASRPELRLWVAGARPSRPVRAWVRAAGGELEADPGDLRSRLRSCLAAVAPLRGGAGMPLKVLEAWTVGTPVVASGWAARGVAGSHGRDLAIAETPGEWVAAVERLLDDPGWRSGLVAGGRASLRQRFSRDVVFSGLRSVVEEAVQPAG